MTEIKPKAAAGRNLGSESYLLFVTRYAFRNLWRNSRRTSLTLSTVLFSVAVAIIANRYSTAVMQLWQDGAADTGTAHVQIHAAGYWQKQEGVQLDLTMPYGNEAEQMVRQDSAVAASVRRLELEGIFSTGEESTYFLGKGVEANGEVAVSPRLFTKNDEGVFVSPAAFDGVVVGQGLAESLNLKIGSEATLITQTVQGSVNGIDVRVVGIVDAAIPSFSKRVVYANIELLQKLIRMPERYTELAVKLKPNIKVEDWLQAKKFIEPRSNTEMHGWWQVEPVIKNVGNIWDSAVILITFLLFLSTALSVLNIIFMMVGERTVEIGTLMAIGARTLDVKFLFALESTLIGIIGGALGVVVGNLGVLAMDYFGVTFQSPFGSEALVIHPHIHVGLTATIYALAVLICCLSALPPARKAANVEPVRAFRGQMS